MREYNGTVATALVPLFLFFSLYMDVMMMRTVSLLPCPAQLLFIKSFIFLFYRRLYCAVLVDMNVA